MSKVEISAREAATPERVARIKAAWQGREIPGLNPVTFALFIAAKESGNKYRPSNEGGLSRGFPLGLNQFGFSGMYQVGAAGLEDAGFIKPGKSKWKKKYQNMGRCLMDQSNWTSLCPGGLEQFLNTPELQELAFAKYTNKNKGYIRALSNILTPGLPPTELTGYLGAAHLKGWSGAVDLASGKISKDANGADTAQYYRIGVASQLA